MRKLLSVLFLSVILLTTGANSQVQWGTPGTGGQTFTALYEWLRDETLVEGNDIDLVYNDTTQQITVSSLAAVTADEVFINGLAVTNPDFVDSGICYTDTNNTITASVCNEALDNTHISPNANISLSKLAVDVVTEAELVANDYSLAGNIAFTGSLAAPNSTTLPGTCSTGEVYLDTDGAANQKWYACIAADTWELQGGGGGGASQLSDLTDVNTSTPTNRNVLVADGVDWESRALVEADISDLSHFAPSTLDTDYGAETITSSYDFGSGSLEIPNSITLPASCTVGQIYMDTDATSGERIYACESTDTWALQGGGGGISNVVEDTTPQLGGSLDVNGFPIVSSANGIIEINPDGTGTVRFPDLLNCDTIDTDAEGDLLCGTDASGSGGTANILDLGDDGTNESADLVEFAFVNDTGSVWSEPLADKLLFDGANLIYESELDSEAELEGQLADVTNVFTNKDGALTDDDLTNNSVGDLSDVASTTPADRHVLLYDGVTDNRYENRLLVEADISDLSHFTPTTIDGDYGNETITSDFDFGGGTLQIPNGTTLPASCEVGDQFMDTDAPTGQRHYLCESANTWALQGDGGGGGGEDLSDNNIGELKNVDETGATANNVFKYNTGVIYLEEFTAANGTTLESLTPTIGTGVTQVAGGTSDMIVQSNRGQSENYGVGWDYLYIVDDNPTPDFYSISFDWFDNGSANVNSLLGFVVNYIDLSNYYSCLFINNESRIDIHIMKRSGGGWSVLASDTATTFNFNNETIKCEIDYSASNPVIKIYETGIERLSVTDSSSPLTKTGKAGVGTGEYVGNQNTPSAATQIQIDNLTVAGSPIWQPGSVDWTEVSNKPTVCESDGTNCPADDAGLDTAGRSLTASGSTVDADAELYTDSKTIWFEDPTADDDFKTIWVAPVAVTITKIHCETDQTVNFDLQVDDGTPADVNGTDIACTSTFSTDSSFAGDATMAAGDRLDLAIASVSGTPTWVSITVEYTKDD